MRSKTRPGLDGPGEHVGQQLVEVGPHRGDAAAQRLVAQPNICRIGGLRAVGGADEADRPAGAQRCRRPAASTRSVPTHSSTASGPIAAEHLLHQGHALLAALGDHAGRAERARQRLPVGVAGHDHHLLGAEATGRDHRALADRAVADDDHRRARADAGRHGRVVPGAHHVREGQQAGDLGVVGAAGDRHQRAVGQRDPHGLALAAVDGVPDRVAVAPEAALRRRRSAARGGSARRCRQLVTNGAMTKSPDAPRSTSAPTSSTTPTNSWPIRTAPARSAMPR